MQDMIRHKACDILMPDLQRIGGLSEMRRVAALASANNMQISTHIFTEHSLSIAGTVSNCISVEHTPWLTALFNQKIDIEHGKIAIPAWPGTGFSFNKDAIQHYLIS